MSEEHTTHTSVAPAAQSLKNVLGVPVAIVIGALVIGAAIIYTGNQKGGAPVQIAGAPNVAQETPEIDVAPITDKDHIRGNPNAPIVIVEYSDFDCPFCKNFHETMQQVMETYGKDGKVAWVYRQFPLQQLHPNAPKVAAASECVASLGGNEAFWKFADLIVGDRGVNEPTNLMKLPEYAAQAGVDKTKFTACVDAGTFNDKITADVQAAVKAGAQGTPYSILIAGDQQGPIDGAQPYANVKQMIDTVLAQIGG